MCYHNLKLLPMNTTFHDLSGYFKIETKQKIAIWSYFDLHAPLDIASLQVATVAPYNYVAHVYQHLMNLLESITPTSVNCNRGLH